MKVFDPYSDKEKSRMMLFHFTKMKKEGCLLASKVNANTICLESTCVIFSKCCYGNLCNTVENFKLGKLAIYSDSKNQNLTNSYSKYTSKRCSIHLKDKNIKKTQACIVATEDITDTTITRQNENITVNTTPSKASSTLLNYTTDLLALILLSIYYTSAF